LRPAPPAPLLTEVVLPSPGVDESFLVIAELTQRPGRADDSKARLAEIYISSRVSTKMLGHHLMQLRDLRIQSRDDADLSDHDCRIGSLGGARLTQTRGPQHR